MPLLIARYVSVFFLAAAALCSQAALPSQITWATDLNSALRDAANRKSIVMVSLVLPGERASDDLEQVHYRDATIGELSQHTVNLQYQLSASGEAIDDERALRTRLFNDVAALPAVPLHIFLKPGEDAEVISSVPYALTVGQLEWAWVDAIRKVQPDFTWTLSDAARGPELLTYGEVARTPSILPPPTDAEVDAAIDELKKGGRGIGIDRIRQYYVIIRSPAKIAVKYGTTSLRSLGRTGLKQRILRAIGEQSPRVWSTVAAEHLEDRDKRIRQEAARALESLLDPKSLNVLRKQIRREDDPEIYGRLLRAMAAIAPTDSKVATTLTKALTQEKSAEIRAQAVVAASVLEQPQTVQRLLCIALDDADALVRSAAAYSIAARRETSLAQTLQTVAAAETKRETKQHFELALTVLEGADLSGFKFFVTEKIGDRLERGPMSIADLFGRGGNADGR